MRPLHLAAATPGQPVMQSIKHRFVLFAAASATAISFAHAQTYPAKPVRVITPWPTGGLTDVAGRLVFAKISESMGQQFLIDNRPGATGSIGADVVAKSPPDGYTLMIHSASHLSNAYTYPKL